MHLTNTPVLASTGTLSIGVDAAYVRFLEEDLHGGDDHFVSIPRLAFVPVLARILNHLTLEELVDIERAALKATRIVREESSND